MEQPIRVRPASARDGDTTIDRYARQHRLPGWSQDRLSRARVLVVGAGALGNELLKNLALVGVGHVYVLDFDRVERSNLSRALLFREQDVGRLKAEVAAERTRDLNPDIRVHALCGTLPEDVGLGLIRRMDVVAGCLDNREARRALNRLCARTGRPWVDGGIDAMRGAVKVFTPPHGPCYECGLTQVERAADSFPYLCTASTPDERELGIVPTALSAAAIIAGVQAQEVLKLLHGRGAPGGTAFLYHGESLESLRVELSTRTDCLFHEPPRPVVCLEASHSLTVGGLLAAACTQLGDGAQVHLDRQLLLRYHCMECGAVEPVLRPYRAPSLPPLPCPCGEDRYPELTHVLEADPDLAPVRLRDLGFPPLHVFEARGPQGVAFLELSADWTEPHETEE